MAEFRSFIEGLDSGDGQLINGIVGSLKSEALGKGRNLEPGEASDMIAEILADHFSSHTDFSPDFDKRVFAIIREVLPKIEGTPLPRSAYIPLIKKIFNRKLSDRNLIYLRWSKSRPKTKEVGRRAKEIFGKTQIDRGSTGEYQGSLFDEPPHQG